MRRSPRPIGVGRRPVGQHNCRGSHRWRSCPRAARPAPPATPSGASSYRAAGTRTRRCDSRCDQIRVLGHLCHKASEFPGWLLDDTKVVESHISRSAAPPPVPWAECDIVAVRRRDRSGRRQCWSCRAHAGRPRGTAAQAERASRHNRRTLAVAEAMKRDNGPGRAQSRTGTPVQHPRAGLGTSSILIPGSRGTRSHHSRCSDALTKRDRDLPLSYLAVA